MNYTCLTTFFILLTWQHTSGMPGSLYCSTITACHGDRTQAALTFIGAHAALVSYNVS